MSCDKSNDAALELMLSIVFVCVLLLINATQLKRQGLSILRVRPVLKVQLFIYILKVPVVPNVQLCKLSVPLVLQVHTERTSDTESQDITSRGGCTDTARRFMPFRG